MAWLQSSFTSHQLLGDSSNNHKKTFKSGAVKNKNSDPDKSDTPLLHDSIASPGNENSASGWLKSSSTSTDKKHNLPGNSSKSSFLSHGLFDKSLGNTKSKTNTSQNASNASSYGKKPSENMKLLSDKDNKNHPLFDHDDDEEEDSDEDEWCIPRPKGYQKVRPCAE